MALSLSHCNNCDDGQELLNMNGIDNDCNIVMNDIKNVTLNKMILSV